MKEGFRENPARNRFFQEMDTMSFHITGEPTPQNGFQRMVYEVIASEPPRSDGEWTYENIWPKIVHRYPQPTTAREVRTLQRVRFGFVPDALFTLTRSGLVETFHKKPLRNH